MGPCTDGFRGTEFTTTTTTISLPRITYKLYKIHDTTHEMYIESNT